MDDHKSRVKIIQGPVGSGKSAACCMHIFQRALAQPRQADGRQRFRAYVFRESYPKLEETAIRTWRDFFPPGTGAGQFGIFYETRPYRHEVRVGPLELDVIFMAMDDIGDAKAYFMSLEPSLIWFNEGQFAQYDVIREAVGRVSPPRYPAVKDGGCAWGGLIIDTNAPPGDHWIPIMRGDLAAPEWMTEEQRRALQKPESWAFYLQPAGLIERFDDKGELLGYDANPAAENLAYLPANFYKEKVAGQTKAWIDSNIMNRSAVTVDGKPVYPQFRRDVHVSDRPLQPVAGIPVSIGLDFGRQPAAAIGQQLRGDWFIQREFIGRDVSAFEFAPLLKGFLATHYPGFQFTFWGDPAGQQRGQATDKTPFEVFMQRGMTVRPAPNPRNELSVRHEAMNKVLMERSAAGRPSRMLIDPGCVALITGMGGGYFLRRLRVSGERYAEEPEKNQYSHICFGRGTPISTPSGPRPIESLSVGDVVCTPLGKRPVISTMAHEASVRRYDFSSGASFLCTTDHPVYLEKGFCAIDAVGNADLIWTEGLQWKLRFWWRQRARARDGQSSPFAAKGITVGQTAISAINAVVTFIVTFGQQHSAGYRTAMSSTTRTGTQAITIWKISNAFQPRSTRGFTWRRLNAGLHLRGTYSAPLLRPPTGAENIRTAPRQSPSAARLVSSLTSPSLAGPHCAATTAAASTKDLPIFERTGADSARSVVFKRPEWLAATIMKIASVPFVATLFRSIGTIFGRRVRVIAKGNLDRALVYNISVAEAHCYYACGILVSNCEALENLLLGGGEGAAVTMGDVRAGPVRLYKQNRDLRRISA